jgi:serine/threonine protein kinase/tetratricopeptide (TPR) repeat protein
MPADPAAVKAVFLQAVEMTDPSARSAFLAERCGADADLLSGVSALLAAHDSAGEGAGTVSCAGGASTADRPGRDEHVGAVLAGKYKLVEAIGEGGMGAVYLAQQTEPVKRAVAVKVIKAGMDSKAVLARFEAERQALALMDHPNIAKVLDAGTTESGRPFFVMELVKGVPVTQFCDERKLTPRQRLELFVPVCQAIQHAHQKGVIHRDIKPSNVLVALYDDRPVPKVIDFGVAKAAGQTLTDKTLMTGFGAVVGTPEYMSPEQASLNNLDVDTRSDVYSLGVLLYELLTGSTPVDRKSLGKAALMEVLRIVREVEAPKPSAKLSTLDTLPSVAANRGTEPAKLSRLMKGELDWLVLKALEKDRTRRYDTANGLAADVQRYLSGEPVQAVPPSAAYRLKKFARRNRGPVAAVSLILLALLFGIAGTTFGLLRAEQKRREAEQARADETAAKEEAVAQRQLARQAEATMLADYRASTDDAIEHLIGAQTDLGPRARQYLENALRRWQGYAARTGDDELSRDIRAEGHLRVGMLWARLGELNQAEKEYRIALDLFGQLVAQFPANPTYLLVQSHCHNNLGTLLSEVGRWADARAAYAAALSGYEKLIAADRVAAEAQEARVRTHINQGELCQKSGAGDAESERSYLSAIRLMQALTAEIASSPDRRSDLSFCRLALANIFRGSGRWQEAEAMYGLALDVQAK